MRGSVAVCALFAAGFWGSGCAVPKADQAAAGPVAHRVVAIEPLNLPKGVGAVTVEPIGNAVGYRMNVPSVLLTREVRAAVRAARPSAAGGAAPALRLSGEVIHYEPPDARHAATLGAEIVVKLAAWDADGRMAGMAHVVARAAPTAHCTDQELAKAVAAAVLDWLHPAQPATAADR